MHLQLMFCIGLIGSIYCVFGQTDENGCIKANAESCGKCIQAGPSCGCCMNSTFLQEGMPTSAWCDGLEALKKKGCHPDDIENPTGSTAIKKNKNVTNHSKRTAEKLQPKDITQFHPQQLALQLQSAIDWVHGVDNNMHGLLTGGQQLKFINSTRFLKEGCHVGPQREGA